MSILLFVSKAGCNKSTEMYRSGTLKDSNIISGVYSLFSVVFTGGSVKRKYFSHVLP
jgi:hypothetical protein